MKRVKKSKLTKSHRCRKQTKGQMKRLKTGARARKAGRKQYTMKGKRRWKMMSSWSKAKRVTWRNTGQTLRTRRASIPLTLNGDTRGGQRSDVSNVLCCSFWDCLLLLCCWTRSCQILTRRESYEALVTNPQSTALHSDKRQKRK